MKNIFKKVFFFTLVLSMVLSPSLVQAQSNPASSTFSCTLGASPKIQNLFDYISCIINLSVIPLVFSLAFLLFVYGVVQYVLNDTDGAKREKGKQFMIWGIIALTVMVSTWGLVRLLGGSFGLNTSYIPKVSPN